MEDFNLDPKRPFLDLLRKQLKELEGLLTHHKKIEQKTPTDIQWKILEDTPFYKWVYPLAKKNEKFLPSEIIEVAIQTLDEYIRAIENFSIDQLEAFFMGLGLRWIPFQYWGLEYLRECHKDYKQAVDYFEKIESSGPKEHKWKFLDKDPISALHLIQPERLLHSEIISRDLALLKSILSVLSKKSY